MSAAMANPRTLRILGTRGVPAAHGGFETFAEQLALHLVASGWRVVVYCQEEGSGPVLEDCWQGVERVRIPVRRQGPASTIEFDWRAIRHAARQRELCLTLGYNTAIFCALLRAAGVPNVINMDGIEWSRAKWGPAAKTWFWLNDWAGCWLGNHLVADHPEIERHLATRVRADKITTIAYGADALRALPDAPVRALGLQPGRYLTLVARAEPENSILEVVSGFSRRPRGVQFVVFGPSANPAYLRAVQQAASAEVRILGPVYDRKLVQAVRFHSLAYVHGHRVGGTNPALVEALGAGNAVIAHDNRFNRWVAGDGALYFRDVDSFDSVLAELLGDAALVRRLQHASTARFESEFTWSRILRAYEKLLLAHLPEVDAGLETR